MIRTNKELYGANYMSIDFDKDRWDKIKQKSRLWWEHKLDRPLIQMVVKNDKPGRQEPAISSKNFTALYDESVSAETIVDRWDYDLSCVLHLGDAFPVICPNFGAGVAAAFMGAALDKRNDMVWFHPSKDCELADVEFTYDPHNTWLLRIKDICRAAIDRWKGLVQIGMTEIGRASCRERV
jgi:hypothetical protein